MNEIDVIIRSPHHGHSVSLAAIVIEEMIKRGVEVVVKNGNWTKLDSRPIDQANQDSTVILRLEKSSTEKTGSVSHKVTAEELLEQWTSKGTWGFASNGDIMGKYPDLNQFLDLIRLARETA